MTVDISSNTIDLSTLETTADAAVRQIPPLWPLSSYVAVNPFLGLADRSFEEASAWLEKSAGARTTMPRAYYAEAVDRGDGLMVAAGLR